MNPKQLKVFLAVARTKSFAEAAALVHMSQPAVSLSIKNLEDSLGGRLFTRTTRTTHLTPEGEALMPIAKSLLASWADAEHELHQRFTLNMGKIALAAMPSFAASLLPQSLLKYRQKHANIKVEVHDVLADTVVELVRSGQMEVGISFAPENTQDLNFQTLFNDRFIAVVPNNSPLRDVDELTWAQLLEYDFITLQRPSSVRSMIEEALFKESIDLQVTFDAHQLATIGRMVAEGLGVAVVPALCERQMKEQGAICLPISAPIIARNVGIITKAKTPLSIAAEAMVETLIETFANDKTK